MSEWDFTSYWRRNYEAQEAGAWLAAMATTSAVQVASSMPLTPFLITLAVQGGFAMAAIPKAIRVYQAKSCLLGKEVSFMTLDDIFRHVAEHRDEFYYGEAFRWLRRHGQYAFELQSRDIERIIGKRGLRDARIKGTRWVHGLGMAEEEPCYRPADRSLATPTTAPASSPN